jgi:hypothetical protein
MSIKNDLSENDRQWCLLVNLSTFTVVSIQCLTPALRVPVNNYSWMLRANQRWLTLSEFRSKLGDRAAGSLSSYSNTYTLQRLEEMNERCKS